MAYFCEEINKICIYTMYIYSVSVLCAKSGFRPWVIIGGSLGMIWERTGCVLNTSIILLLCRKWRSSAGEAVIRLHRELTNSKIGYIRTKKVFFV